MFLLHTRTVLIGHVYKSESSDSLFQNTQAKHRLIRATWSIYVYFIYDVDLLELELDGLHGGGGLHAPVPVRLSDLHHGGCRRRRLKKICIENL